ncbi:dihydrolipoyl dehydrogenase family protein [Desulfovibrio inopinatus]|uniref:dihydrolipoyl dehydrogenase family protein n=1 Tax=Desulfovibrio inopinatus TaxID=102109 RepID=UPI00040A1E97|nr:FAD-dependent oxidoreductase [Desulfovibrio inopinatus]
MTSLTATRKCDLIIVGGGPAGYDAARLAASKGRSVTLIEREHLGGTCLNWGCIPTKLYLAATCAQDELAGQAKAKIASGTIQLDFAALRTKKDRLITATRKAMVKQLDAAGIELIQGDVTAITEKTVHVNDTILSFQDCILALGSRSAVYPGLAPDHEVIHDSSSVFDIPEIPSSIIIVGAGAIGIEFAHFFHRLGTKVDIFEAAPRIVPAGDPNISASLAQILKRAGYGLHTNACIESVCACDGQAVLTMSDGTKHTAEKILLALGRTPNTESVDVSETTLSLDQKGFIQVDDHLQAAPHIYATGDVNGRMLLAHAAAHQAEYAVDHACGHASNPYTFGPYPSIVYGSPETMSTGRTVAELQAQGLSPQISQSPLIANPIAQGHATTGGFVKVIWNEDRVAGVTAVGHGVSQLTTTATIMCNQGWTREDVRHFIFPHPTLDEALKDALLAPRKDA